MIIPCRFELGGGRQKCVEAVLFLALLGSNALAFFCHSTILAGNSPVLLVRMAVHGHGGQHTPVVLIVLVLDPVVIHDLLRAQRDSFLPGHRSLFVGRCVLLVGTHFRLFEHRVRSLAERGFHLFRVRSRFPRRPWLAVVQWI